MSWFNRLFGGSTTTGQAVNQSTLSGPSNAGGTLTATGNGHIVWTQGAGGGGGGGGGKSGNIVIQTGNSTLTVQQVSQLLGLTPLTDEEKKELEELQRQYNEETKQVRLDEFKKMPTQLRQFVINVITWKKNSSIMSTLHASKSERLKELESRNNGHTTLGTGGINLGSWLNIQGDSTWNIDINVLLGLPNNISPEDLEAAHVEATIEEEMLESNV